MISMKITLLTFTLVLVSVASFAMQNYKEKWVLIVKVPRKEEKPNALIQEIKASTQPHYESHIFTSMLSEYWIFLAGSKSDIMNQIEKMPWFAEARLIADAPFPQPNSSLLLPMKMEKKSDK